MVNEILLADTRGHWGCLLGKPKNGDQLLGVEVQAICVLISAMKDSLGSWRDTQKAQLIAEGVNYEGGVCREVEPQVLQDT